MAWHARVLILLVYHLFGGVIRHLYIAKHHTEIESIYVVATYIYSATAGGGCSGHCDCLHDVSTK